MSDTFQPPPASDDEDPVTFPVTVADLLPAMMELASIQSDLLRTLENPRPGYQPNLGGGLSLAPKPVPIDVARLRHRSSALIRWLLKRVEPPK